MRLISFPTEIASTFNTLLDGCEGNRVRRIPKIQGSSGVKRDGIPLHEIPIRNMEWQEFFSEIREEKIHPFQERLKVLDAAKELFREYRSLCDMPTKEDRQHIGGFRRSADINWLWFGSMKGAGGFMNLINNDPAIFSGALDKIPSEDTVRRDHYKAFIDHYRTPCQTTKGKPFRHGLGTATRLLAMKRPDYFVCLNNANRTGLAGAFGVAIKSHDYDDYWDKIVEPVCLSRWWGPVARCVEIRGWRNLRVSSTTRLGV